MRRIGFGIRSFAAALALGLATALASVSGVQAATGSHAAAQAEDAQTIVVHLSHFTDDLHAAHMALSLSKALRDQGADVTLFLDLEGVRLADSRSRDDLAWGDSGGVGDAFDAFVSAGGTVGVCSHCAAQASVTAETLREGAQLLAREQVAALFLAADKVIDY